MILVTGATSAVGTAVLKELLARKIPVRAFVHKPFVAERLEAQGVEAFLGDMTEQESVHKALQCKFWNEAGQILPFFLLRKRLVMLGWLLERALMRQLIHRIITKKSHLIPKFTRECENTPLRCQKWMPCTLSTNGQHSVAFPFARSCQVGELFLDSLLRDGVYLKDSEVETWPVKAILQPWNVSTKLSSTAIFRHSMKSLHPELLTTIQLQAKHPE
jgi:hypothetical protein